MCRKAWMKMINQPICIWQCDNSFLFLFQNTTMPYFHHFVAESVVNNKCCNYQQSANNNSKSNKGNVNTINHFSIISVHHFMAVRNFWNYHTWWLCQYTKSFTNYSKSLSRSWIFCFLFWTSILYWNIRILKIK